MRKSWLFFINCITVSQNVFLMLLNLETNRIIKSVYDSQIFISCPFPLPAENPFYNIQAIEVGFLNRMPNRNCPTFILSCATKPMKRTSQFVRTTKATSNGRRKRQDLFLLASFLNYVSCFPWDLFKQSKIDSWTPFVILITWFISNKLGAK